MRCANSGGMFPAEEMVFQKWNGLWVHRTKEIKDSPWLHPYIPPVEHINVLNPRPYQTLGNGLTTQQYYAVRRSVVYSEDPTINDSR